MYNFKNKPKASAMSKHPSLLEQFRSFYFQNNPKNVEEAIKYFAVFGGMGWNVDTSKPLEELIESKVLNNYTYIHSDVTKVTQSDKICHSVLTGLAMGDRRTHSAFKRARIGRQEGEDALEKLYNSDIIELEYSQESAPNERDSASQKVNFTAPFIRFWFSFISPFFKTIKVGDYKESKERFTNLEQGFSELIFQKLALEVIKKNLTDDPIVEIGSYWDKNTEIDILAKTKSGKIVAGICKYSNAKANKNELTKLKEQCKIAELTPDICVIVSKNGFSNELKNLKSAELKLFSLKNFKSLVEDLSESDLLQIEGKKY